MIYKPFTSKYTQQIIDNIKLYLEETDKTQTRLDTLDICHLLGEIERLNNIIKEFEKFLIDVKGFPYLDKLQELKGSDSNE